MTRRMNGAAGCYRGVKGGRKVTEIERERKKKELSWFTSNGSEMANVCLINIKGADAYH